MTEAKNYSRLPTSEEDGVADSPSLALAPGPVSHLQSSFRYVAIVLGMFFMLGLGYFIGSQGAPVSRDNTIEPTGDLHYYMRFNASFAQKSSPSTDALWDSLFPEKLGFVQHPELAPNVAGIAVFHELHCLNMLRMAFFASVDGTLEEMGDESHDKNHRTSHHHIRHCFEYLRQSLMCLADSNMEEMNFTIQGVSGWQSERTCRDYEGLKAFSNEYGIAREDALHNYNLTNNQ